MKKILFLFALFPVFSASPANADNKTLPETTKSQKFSKEKMIEESEKSGDPSKPADLEHRA